ncbi:MAG TPA: DUF503 domain-containing protein [Acidimicrobiales bacterium]|jgi:hypothetical protein
MFACALSIDLHLPECRSLKAKRAVVKPIVEGLRRRYHVAAAEVGHADSWQRAELGVAVVSGSQHHASDILDEVERYVWSFPEVQVLATSRSWLEDAR